MAEDETGESLVFERAASFAVFFEEAQHFGGAAFVEHGAVDDAEMALDDVSEFRGEGWSFSVNQIADSANEHHLGMRSTVVGKGKNVILNPKHYVTYVNMTGFLYRSISHSNFSFSFRTLGDIYILVKFSY